MAETDSLEAQKRDGFGSQSTKRLRLSGLTPAVLYGQGKDTMTLSVPTEGIEAAIRHGAHLVKLTGAVRDNALVKDIQWDALGTKILHVDFTRVDMSESVTLSLSLELRGEAPGTKQGGVVEQTAREIQVECPVSAIPEKLQLSINELEVDCMLTAADIELPEGSKLVSEGTMVVASCTVPQAVEEEEAPAETGAEPEVIGGSKEEESNEG